MTNKILPLDELVNKRQRWREDGKTVVFTNGAFDLLHVGHVRYLQAARALGDLLIVGLNNDASVRGNKGPQRPLVAEDERAELLAALVCVDYVVLFGEPTADNLLRALEPDIYVKGGDYVVGAGASGQKQLPEAPTVQAYGGKIEFIPFVPGRSTTNLIEKIRASDRPARRSDSGRDEKAD